MNLRGLDVSRVWPLSRAGEELFGNTVQRSLSPISLGEVN